MPVTAMTYFLPSALLYRSSRKGRRLRAVGRAAVPVTGARLAPVRPLGPGLSVCAILGGLLRPPTRFATGDDLTVVPGGRGCSTPDAGR
jgi:hypothetical protein